MGARTARGQRIVIDREDHCEFVASNSCRNSVRTGLLLEFGRNCLQGFISGAMPVLVIEKFEMIYVHNNNSRAAVGFTR